MGDDLDNFLDDMERGDPECLYDAICSEHGVQGVMPKDGYAVCDWPCGRRLILGEQVQADHYKKND